MTQNRTLRPFRSGFTLVELLVVISIIAVLLGLLFPVIGAVRAGAREAATRATMTSIITASGQYRADNADRLPGVFSQEEMGQTSNVGEGFTQMENAILDLVGGVIRDPQANRNNYILVGPSSNQDDKVPVDLGRIGAADGPQYLTLGDDQLSEGSDGNGRSQQLGADEHVAIPDVVDAFGYPILMWTRNQFAGNVPVFAEKDASDDGVKAQFYWASNAGFLNSQTLGNRFNSNNYRNSCLSDLVNSDDQIERSLQGLLGDPASPLSNTSPPAPARPRGDIIMHSAGKDGFFVESDSRQFDQLVYVPTGGGGIGNSISSTDATLDSINDIILGGGG